MAILGALWLLNKYQVIHLAFLDFGPDQYHIRVPKDLKKSDPKSA